MNILINLALKSPIKSFKHVACISYGKKLILDTASYNDHGNCCFHGISNTSIHAEVNCLRRIRRKLLREKAYNSSYSC